jgi:dipeptidase, putative
MSFGNKILKYQDDIMKDLAQLVAIPSVRGKAAEGQPFGKECADALSCILNRADQMGFATKNVGNYAGHAEYGEGDEVAAVVTHMDIVPAGEGWETDPFTLTRKGNLYFGRGTADDKGAAIVSLYCLKVLKEENVPAKRRLRAIFGAGEETGSEDLEKYLESEQLPVMAFTPDSDYGICNREKGILRFCVSSSKNDSKVISEFVSGTVVNAVPSKAVCTIRCSDEQYADLQRVSSEAKGDFHFEKTHDGARITSVGKASHAMQPQEGFNAAAYLIKLLTEVFSPDELGSLMRFVSERIGTELDGSTLGIRQEDPHSGALTLNLGLFNMGTNFASAGFDVRYPVTSNGEQIFSAVSAQAAEFGLDATLNADTKPLFLPESSPFITLLQDSYAVVTGKQAELYATGGGTYARAFKGNAVAFGLFFPGEPDRRLHNTGEHIDIEYFMLHAQVCLEAMYRMLTA